MTLILNECHQYDGRPKRPALSNFRWPIPEKRNASKAVSAIEAIIDEKVEGVNRRYEELLHKDLEIPRSDVDKKLVVMQSRRMGKLGGLKSDLSKTIYIIGLVQVLASVGSVLGLLVFMART